MKEQTLVATSYLVHKIEQEWASLRQAMRSPEPKQLTVSLVAYREGTMGYKIIYADPPWHYDDKSKSHGGGAESHYPVMKIPELCKLEIPADKDSVLLMWATFPQLEEAFKVINAWGFKYKTGAFTWVKTTKKGTIYMGMGRHTRANAEVCLLATRGKGVPRINASVYNTQLHPRTKHSEKPQVFRDEIVRLYGDLPRLEMFARQKDNGWDVWGNEVENDTEIN